MCQHDFVKKLLSMVLLAVVVEAEGVISACWIPRYLNESWMSVERASVEPCVGRPA